eukprot:scaffold213996_cov39-Prasinocladus_malaysianus.AAC.1
MIIAGHQSCYPRPWPQIRSGGLIHNRQIVFSISPPESHQYAHAGEEAKQALELALLLLLRQVVKARQQDTGPEGESSAEFEDVVWLADLAGSLARAASPAKRLRAFSGLLAGLPKASLSPKKDKPSRSLQALIVTFVTEQLRLMNTQSSKEEMSGLARYIPLI